MAGAGEVVAEGLARVLAQKDPARVLHPAEPGVGVLDREAEVLGGVEVRKLQGLLKVLHEHDSPVFQSAPRHLFPGKVFELVLEGFLHRVREGLARGEEPGLGEPVVLGLGEEVGGDELGVRARVGDDQGLGGAGEAVDADVAVDLLFRQGDEEVAGTHDLVHPGHALGAVGEGGDRLRPAHGEEPVGAGGPGGGEDRGVGPRRGGDDDLADPGHPRRHHRHQDGGEERGGPPGDVDPDPPEGSDELAEDAVRAGVEEAALGLLLVEGLDADPGLLDRLPEVAGEVVVGLAPELLGNLVDRVAVEPFAPGVEGGVALFPHLGDDPSHRLGGGEGLAEELGEGLPELGASLEAQPAGRKARPHLLGSVAFHRLLLRFLRPCRRSGSGSPSKASVRTASKTCCPSFCTNFTGRPSAS